MVTTTLTRATLTRRWRVCSIGTHPPTPRSRAGTRRTPSSFASDLANADALGTSMAERENLYNPLYYLCGSYEGYGTSTPAKYWRIRTGIEQGDTSLTTEVNLALALRANDSVEDVDFATVWGVGHSMAERTGSGTENFIAWVRRCAS